MAAALRHAAKRLGGGVLQRSREARRLLHTPTKAADDTKTVANRLSQIKEKRDELYNLVADFEKTCKAPTIRIAFRNNELANQLSAQVDPRPNDPYWRICRRAQRKTRFFTNVGICSSGVGTALGLHWLITEGFQREKNWAEKLEDWWNKQMR